MKLLRMGHAALHVVDLGRSLAFYEGVLGLKSQWSKDADWANVRLGSDDLSLVRQEGHRHPPHLGFRIATFDELEQAFEEVSKKGLKPEPLMRHRDGTASFYLRDPDGNILEILWDPADK